jgi:hypothetical protein
MRSKAKTPTTTLMSSTCTSFFARFERSWKVRYAPVSLSTATISASRMKDFIDEASSRGAGFVFRVDDIDDADNMVRMSRHTSGYFSVMSSRCLPVSGDIQSDLPAEEPDPDLRSVVPLHPAATAVILALWSIGTRVNLHPLPVELRFRCEWKSAESSEHLAERPCDRTEHGGQGYT